jgi:hypothetical protein
MIRQRILLEYFKKRELYNFNFISWTHFPYMFNILKKMDTFHRYLLTNHAANTLMNKLCGK